MSRIGNDEQFGARNAIEVCDSLIEANPIMISHPERSIDRKWRISRRKPRSLSNSFHLDPYNNKKPSLWNR
jgi:hypothetical protein